MRIRATILAVAAAGAGFSATATPALAETGPQQATRLVSYSDLNLNAAAGRAELQSRIEAAARRVCSHNGVRTLPELTLSTHCRADAIRSASEQLAAVVG